MTTWKPVKIAILGSMLALALTACAGSQDKDSGGDSDKNAAATGTTQNDDKENIADIRVSELAQQMASARSDVNFVEMTDSYIEGVMSMDLSKFSEYSVYVDASGTTVDEFGIFKANEDSSDDVLAMLQDYLDMRLETWMEEYMPEEKPKVQNAEIKHIGNYYIYAILDDAQRKQAFSEFENALVK